MKLIPSSNSSVTYWRKHVLIWMLCALVVPASGKQWVGIRSNTPASVITEVVSSSAQSTVVRLTIQGFYLGEADSGAYKVEVPGMVPILRSGSHSLPCLCLSLVVAPHSRRRVRVVNYSWREYSDIKIAPSAGHLLRAGNDSLSLYFQSITSEVPLPDQICYLRAPYQLRELSGQTLVVNPFVYQPESLLLKVYDQLEIEVFEEGNGGQLPPLKSLRGQLLSAEFENIFREQFVNYLPVKNSGSAITENMLILCPVEFINEIKPFVSWKRSRGINAVVKNVSRISSQPEKIRDFVKEYYKSNGLTYLLLVGDHEHIPAKLIAGEYSDNYYGYLEGDDSYNEVLVGRFPANNPMQVQNQVKKVLYYEREIGSDANWLTQAMGIARNEGDGRGHRNGESDYVHMDGIRDALLSYTYRNVFREYEANLPSLQNTSAEQISNRINSGVSLVNYCGHGTSAGWRVGGYGAPQVGQLSNLRKWPIIFSVACEAGNFIQNTCFAEQWMWATDPISREPTGALGGKFSASKQTWQPPMTGQDEMIALLTGPSENWMKTLGGITTSGSMRMIDHYGTEGRIAHDSWILFGDPSLVFRTNMPAAIKAAHPSAIRSDVTCIEINSDAEGAMVCLSMGDSILAVGRITNHQAALQFSGPLDPGWAKLVLFAYNRVTYQSMIQILPQTVQTNNDNETSKGETPRINALHISPNPSHGQVIVSLPSKPRQPCVLTVCDIAGKVIRTWRIFSPEYPIPLDLSGLGNGIYHLRIENGREIYSGKVIVIK